MCPHPEVMISELRKIRVAGQYVDSEMLWHALASYARSDACVLRWYDRADLGAVLPASAIDLHALGRLHFTGVCLSPTQTEQFMGFDVKRHLSSIPSDAHLAEADPKADGGLYDAAEGAHRAYLAMDRRFGSTLVSSALALLRPHLFPILTPPIRMLYESVAEQSWFQSQKAERPFSRRTYWPVIREDLLTATHQLALWRAKLSVSEIEGERWLSHVSDVRLWGVATRALAAGTVPGSR
jgi:hypothetical protein